MRFLRSYALYLAWVVSLLGLLMSLYFGEMLRFEPCRLCWYQRICLFPLALILGIGAYKEDSRIASYALPLAAIGGLFAFYQLLEIYIPVLRSPALCGYTSDCADRTHDLWGVAALPLLSLLGFLSLIGLLWLARANREYSSEK
ncbi:MAG: disulfide bond formation protein B [Verrucomicrobia bacterium]|nr:disulfide bond formation protein B [Verrucomicrobiota bacterium]